MHTSALPADRTQLSKRGFTLVELLVVIGIIAIMISILLPTLNKVKRRAMGTACASNMKQIYTACAMFATDHKGHLPRPYKTTQLSSDTTNKYAEVCAFAQKRLESDPHIDFDDNKGGLWKYLPGKETRKKVMFCGSDDGMDPISQNKKLDPAYPRNFSYSFNSLILNPDTTPATYGIVLAKVRQSASKIMIFEELAPNDSWCRMGRGNTNGDDIPSGRHGAQMKDAYRANPYGSEYRSAGIGNYCFFDGHVESLTPGQILWPTGNSRYHTPLIAGDPETWYP